MLKFAVLFPNTSYGGVLNEIIESRMTMVHYNQPTSLMLYELRAARNYFDGSDFRERNRFESVESFHSKRAYSNNRGRGGGRRGGPFTGV